jgi:hypothetical protein
MNALAHIDYVELVRPGLINLYAGGRIYGSVTVAEDLGATLSTARNYIRAGIPVLDRHGWTNLRVDGFTLLSAHDHEFVVRNVDDLSVGLIA